MAAVHVGVDVGGTNTDAVVLQGTSVIGWSKTPTTSDITSGISTAITAALNDALEKQKASELVVSRVHIGTTQYVNAVVQRRGLARVSVLRLCGPSTTDLPPFCDFPEDLKQTIGASVYLLNGGYQFDGQTEIGSVDSTEVKGVIKKIRNEGIRNVVISGIFSLVNPQHEIQVGNLFCEHFPECSFTLSHRVGQMGILERENAAILNESLKPLSKQTIFAFREALDSLGLACPFYLTQNDGTLLSADQSLEIPVFTFASGPTNSMRGAAYLSGVDDAIVIDIGGTSTDAGLLLKGFPREASFKVKIGGVKTNFRMPDVVSVGLGGGSIVLTEEESHGNIKIQVGPQSTGCQLVRKGLVFGGQTLTATDIAVASGLTMIGNPDRLSSLPPDVITAAREKIRTRVESLIDQIKLSTDSIPVVLVGGGSILIDTTYPLHGASIVIKPSNYGVANAVGAALSHVSGSVDYVLDLTEMTREVAINDAMERASQAAVQAGAEQTSIQITDVFEVPLAYLPGTVTRVKVKAVGNLADRDSTGVSVKWIYRPVSLEELAIPRMEIDNLDQMYSITGQEMDGDRMVISATETDPTIDPSTGEWIISEWDIECIAVGAGILGCGGGGSPALGRLHCLRALKDGKTLKVVTPERLASKMKPNDLAVPVSNMGAPTIGIERPWNISEATAALNCMLDLYNIGGYSSACVLLNEDGADVKTAGGVTYIENYQPSHENSQTIFKTEAKTFVGIVCGEIGGSNSMVPLILSAETGLPAVDCDLMGRAFPELQMTTPPMYGVPAYPACLTDYDNQRAVILKCDTAKDIENLFRKICISMGCRGSYIGSILSRTDLLKTTVLHSISRAWRLGQAVLHSRRMKESAIEAILHHEGGMVLIEGKVLDVKLETLGGFARGQLMVEGFETYEGKLLKIDFQNEFLVASDIEENKKNKVLACTPDLISVVDRDSGEPIPTEHMRYGLRVAVLAMPASPVLTTPEGLTAVGPQAFGFPDSEVQFCPMPGYIEHDPIPPV